jgi:cytochrome oxidase assembly protein ShyY1
MSEADILLVVVVVAFSLAVWHLVRQQEKSEKIAA